jgi:hypothetical protein
MLEHRPSPDTRTQDLARQRLAMAYENQMIHSGKSGDDGDAALDAALAAADEDTLAAIRNGVNLDAGLARILQDLGEAPTARPSIHSHAPVYPGKDQTIPWAPLFPGIRLPGLTPPDADAASPIPPLPREQAAAIIAMRARVRDLADALADALASARGLYLAVRDLDWAEARGRAVPGLARDLALARDITCDLTRARALARHFTRASASGRDFEVDYAIGLTRAADSADDLVRDLAIAHGLARAVDLAGDLARDLSFAHGLGCVRDLADARDLAGSRARDRVADLVRCMEVVLGCAKELVGRFHAGEVDASGADLSALDLTDISVLEGVVWTEETAWPPGVWDQVKPPRSRVIRPGVYQVCSGNERDPFELITT